MTAPTPTPNAKFEDFQDYDELLKDWIKSDPDNILEDGSLHLNKFAAEDRAQLKGDNGDTGYLFTPNVNDDGDISWTNDGGLNNPETRNIKGPKGEDGDPGVTFIPQIADGELSWTNDGGLPNPDPITIVGEDGIIGEDGATFTPSVDEDGELTWTNDKGKANPSPVNIKGPKGEDGEPGEQGEKGDKGDPGVLWSPSVDQDGFLHWTNNGNLPNPAPVNIRGPKGDDGEAAEVSVTGVKGEAETGNYRTGNVILTPDNIGAIHQNALVADFINAQPNKVAAASLTAWLKGTIGWDNAAAHNAIYRGKDITDAFLDGSMSQNIANGTFYDIYPGDYFYKTITWDGVTYTNTKWLVAECDPYMNRGDTAVTAHHIGIIPDSLIGKYRMAATNTTASGFQSSEMWTTTIPKLVIGLKNAFGEAHLIKFRALLTNATDANKYNAGFGTTFASSSWSWVDAWCVLMSNTQVFGFAGFDSSGHDAGEGCTQLACFRHNPQLTTFNRNWFWLRGVTASAGFAGSHNDGGAGHGNASNADGAVRPLILYR